MPSMEETFEAACDSSEIPGVVLMATDITGKFRYAKAFGSRSLKGSTNDPMPLDAVMWIASCTKLMTVIAIMQCAERGQLKLDDEVYTVLPELKELKVLTGFSESNEPIMKEVTTPMTIRNLITHSSGLTYDFWSADLLKWRKQRGEKPSPGRTIVEMYSCPLVADPDTSWSYSTGLDWAGKLVERLNDGMPLEKYMETHVWTPLGIKDMAFFLQKRPDLKARLIDMSTRDPKSGKAVYTDQLPFSYKHPLDAMGGGGVYGTAGEYLKVLHSLLINDGKLLKPSTVDQFFQSQLSDASRSKLNELLKDEELAEMLGGIPIPIKKDWGLGGILILEDLPGNWRKKGTMSWGGLPNLTWWIDREAGICGIYAGQITPPGDKKSGEMTEVFERAMYERLRSEKARI